MVMHFWQYKWGDCATFFGKVYVLILHKFAIVYLKVESRMEHIGQLIRQELRRQERSVAWFARQLSCDRSNIYRIFQKESIDTYLLVRISIILQYNFFSTLSLCIEKQILLQK